MAQNAGRKVDERSGRQGGHVIAAASPTIYQGALVALKSGEAIPAREGTGADNAAKAAEVATHVVVGIAEKTVTAADGKVPTRAGCFLFDNKSDDAVTRSEIGKPCYVFDDHTVAKTSPNNTRAKAGTVVDVESVGVWVRVGV